MPKLNILVTGQNGQLGQSLAKIAKDYPQFDFIFLGREQLDLSQPATLANALENIAFDIIINCAAYTAVDKAESEPELADAINHLAVEQLAQICNQRRATLIHISTDYVFDGKNYNPYIETDPVDPQGVYGITKLKGEQAMQAVNPKGAIIRTSWVYSEFGNNFVKTMLRLGAERDSLNVIYDQVGSPTYATDLAQAILALLSQPEQLNQTQVYHYSNEGVCSWYDFAKAIFEMSGTRCKVNPIETKDYPTPAKRPHYSLMNKAKIKQDYLITIPYWRDSLKIALNCLES
ncbi:MAG: dTDP-4-dehydrorhamnose reductase [Piscirickettsiaceae bacterium CG_4_9_14_3_um_filter_43_564]|nr:dTDP-4-dehydrorhamnose reductase [Thiomicrospira sp.]PIQ04432.1 MAG: dTDP-4-dehydrorhamnose reductase [Piscirickettsiaceae bacterium CG18_big_fil_WC_8_21_14_2_50_44_103]PIU39231.1 MAG: dTDP-4-dehydrorhamnose reductase [Piscirickettsiaceae bacterium CG07_land_8_20_14_0_80_44_28]PIW58257.1 MAG: dTDP-4-dehydrorhamnose reductase [Piscirickettsiaceae bacterium CG12_big_fil_rev_8_21_14_0_65_44_934]PIW78799.1 MAG: dTDP-4-dehydrorhamnose reductase [Piscirickettsiaceae bacterium CG_4_8_14_3_um_filter